jgi:tRNA threonylcarbamoyl adenosine modification protein (Sua5/YciO/YrdC/YwlC family)
MATVYTIHPDNPQKRHLEKIRDALRRGAVMLYPTDTVYAIGCDLNSKEAIARVRRLKQRINDKPLTFLCSSLSNIAEYALVTDSAYRYMKHLIPGPFTFILPATKLVPKLVMNPKRKTTGIRVPDHSLCQLLLESLGNPIISTSAHTLGESSPEISGLVYEDDDLPPAEACHVNWAQAELFDQLGKLVDIIVDDGSEPTYRVSTIVDLTTEEPQILRRGLGWDIVSN